MLLRTPAIVLRTLPYRDTSGIVSLYTQAQGRLDCIAKGLHSKQGVRKFTPLQPGLQIEAIVYVKPGRDLQLLTECALRHPCYHTLTNPVRQIYLQLMLEVFAKAVQEHEAALPLFDLLEHTLQQLDQPEQHPFSLLLSYLIALMQALGFLPLPAQTMPKDWQVVLRVEAGVLEAVPHAPNAAGDWLQHLLMLPPPERLALLVPKTVRAELLAEILAFYTYHLHTDFRNLKSLRIFEELFSA